jgi:hypothetical protein
MDAEKHFVIYASGLVCLSVCVDKNMTTREIERRANMESPTGIHSRWTIAKENQFADDVPMPCRCNTNPGYLHYLLHC